MTQDSERLHEAEEQKQRQRKERTILEVNYGREMERGMGSESFAVKAPKASRVSSLPPATILKRSQPTSHEEHTAWGQSSGARAYDRLAVGTFTLDHL